MSEQPATTSRVKAGFCGSPASPIFPLLAERFDLWLAGIKADAWDEGWVSRHNYDERGGEAPTTNPYEEDRHVDQ